MQSFIHKFLIFLAGSCYESCAYIHNAVEIFSVCIHLLLVYWFYQDILFPYVLFPLRARKVKASMKFQLSNSIPFGIPSMISEFKSIRNQYRMQWIHSQMDALSGKTDLCREFLRWTVRTYEPENVKAILATKFEDYNFRERTLGLAPVFGSGIFTQDGPAWKHSRAMLRPQFSREQIGRLGKLIAHVDNLIEAVHKDGCQVELQKLFHMLTMDSATEFLFGTSVESLKFSDSSRGSYVVGPHGEQVYAVNFVESYTFLNDRAVKNVILGSLKWILKWTSPEYTRHLATARTFIDSYVMRALVETEDYKEDKETTENETFIFSYELAKVTRDPIVIRDQIFNILIAGRDTTAAALSFAFWYFAKYPQTWAKVREEVLSTFPDGDISQLTYESLRKLSYVQMFIKEVLRMHPIVPINSRTAIRDTALPRGGGSNGSEPMLVPKGSRVIYYAFIMHRDKSIYGEDADEFRPERWERTGNVATSTMYTWGYLPFNGGPRICLGQQFALTEMALTVMKMALAFKAVEKAPGFLEELVLRSGLTLSLGGNGLRVRLIPA